MVTTEIKQPLLSAPRFRRSRLHILNSDLLDNFREKYPQYSEVSNDVLSRIIKTFHGDMINTVKDNRDGVELPEGLGFLFIGACPAPKKKESVDVALSLKLNKRVRHRNFQTDDLIAKIFYTNFAAKYRFSNRELWQFKGSREFTRAVSAAFRENWMNYIKVDSYQFINKMFKKAKQKEVIKALPTTVDEHYNEFNMD